MKQIFDTLIKLAIIVGGAYWIYHLYTNDTPVKKSPTARYSENEQDNSLFEDESTKPQLDDCQRHINDAIRQACIDARTRK